MIPTCVLSLLSVAAFPEEAEEMFRTASHFQVQYKYDVAASSYRELINRYPSSSWADDAQFHLAEVLQRQGKVQEAIREYEHLSSVYPDGEWTRWALYLLGSFYASLGDRENLQTAVQRFQGVLDLQGNGKLACAARMGKGDCLLALGRLNGAAEEFEALLDGPLTADAHFYLGSIYMDRRFKQRDVGEALSHFETVANDFPNTPRLAQTLYGMGECHREKGQLEEAAACYGRVMSCQGKENWIWRALASQQLKRIKIVGERGNTERQEVLLRPGGTENAESLGLMDVAAEKIVYTGDVKLKVWNMEISGNMVEIDLLNKTLRSSGGAEILVDGKSVFGGRKLAEVTFTIDSIEEGEARGSAVGRRGEEEAVSISGLGNAGGLISTGTEPGR